LAGRKFGGVEENRQIKFLLKLIIFAHR